MRHIRITAVLIVAAWIAGCAGQATREPAAEGVSPGLGRAKDRIQMFFVSGRNGSVEPCGYSMRPLGGIEREWNALNQYRDPSAASSLFFASGPALGTGVTKKEMATHHKRAEILFEAMAKLKVDAYAPDTEDLQLGDKALKAWAAKSAISFVSANIVDKKGNPAFKSYVQYDLRDGKNMIVTAVAPRTKKAIGGLKVLDPVASLKKVFKSVGGAHSLVVLLSTLNRTERERVVKAFPQINFVFGGDGSESDAAPNQESATLVRAQPSGLGRTVVLAEVERASAAPKQLYSDQAAREWKSAVASWEALGLALRQKVELAALPESAMVKAWKAELRKYEDWITRSREIAERGPEAVNYAIQFLPLDSTFDTAQNPMRPFVDRYRNAGMLTTAGY